jgi:hypothetical protein
MEVSSQLHAPAALHPAKEPQYPLDKRLDVLQSRSAHCGVNKNILHLSGIELRPSSPRPVAIPTEIIPVNLFMVYSAPLSVALIT